MPSRRNQALTCVSVGLQRWIRRRTLGPGSRPATAPSTAGAKGAALPSERAETSERPGSMQSSTARVGCAGDHGAQHARTGRRGRAAAARDRLLADRAYDAPSLRPGSSNAGSRRSCRPIRLASRRPARPASLPVAQPDRAPFLPTERLAPGRTTQGQARRHHAVRRPPRCKPDRVDSLRSGASADISRAPRPMGRRPIVAGVLRPRAGRTCARRLDGSHEC